MSVHFSSASVEWSTPDKLFDGLNTIYQFSLDPCCTTENAKCAKFYTIDDDGLNQDWYGERVFMNPPYGREIAKWMRKAYMSSRHHKAVVVCLVPSRTDTKWWHDYAMKGEITFIRGRLKFGGHKQNAPFPSAIVVFR